MSEVTKEDREAAERWGTGPVYNMGHLAEAFARHREAALTAAQAEAEAKDAEIARLTAERDRLYYDGIHTCSGDCQRVPCVQRRQIEALRAEVERLRAEWPSAIMEQSCCLGLIGKNVVIDCETRAEAEEVLDWLCGERIARAALASEPGK